MGVVFSQILSQLDLKEIQNTMPVVVIYMDPIVTLKVLQVRECSKWLFLYILFIATHHELCQTHSINNSNT